MNANNVVIADSSASRTASTQQSNAGPSRAGSERGPEQVAMDPESAAEQVKLNKVREAARTPALPRHRARSDSLAAAKTRPSWGISACCQDDGHDAQGAIDKEYAPP